MKATTKLVLMVMLFVLLNGQTLAQDASPCLMDYTKQLVPQPYQFADGTPSRAPLKLECRGEYTFASTIHGSDRYASTWVTIDGVQRFTPWLKVSRTEYADLELADVLHEEAMYQDRVITTLVTVYQSRRATNVAMSNYSVYGVYLVNENDPNLVLLASGEIGAIGVQISYPYSNIDKAASSRGNTSVLCLYIEVSPSIFTIESADSVCYVGKLTLDGKPFLDKPTLETLTAYERDANIELKNRIR